MGVALLALTACAHGSKTRGGPHGPEDVLVDTGTSAEPSYSPDGKNLLYVSRDRPTHKQAQVYELNLDTRIERRITFQNGDTFWPRFDPRGARIVYSSSTDELKETPPLLGQATPPSEQNLPYPYNQPLEVYLHALHGFQIQRLSHVKGFDGEARFSLKGDRVIWTRATDKGLEVVSFSRKGKNLKTITPTSSKSTSQMTFAPDGHSKAWVEWSSDYKSSIVYMKAKDAATVVAGTPEAVRTDLQFSPDGKWLMWAENAGHGWQIRIAAVNRSSVVDRPCPAALVAIEGEARDPVLSPDGKWLTFTWIEDGRSRIARIPFQPPSGACPAKQ